MGTAETVSWCNLCVVSSQRFFNLLEKLNTLGKHKFGYVQQRVKGRSSVAEMICIPVWSFFTEWGMEPNAVSRHNAGNKITVCKI